MNNSGDAAEQIVRFGFEGAEVALKITGAAAKNIAAMLYAVLKDQKRTRGKARLDSMIREGKQTAIYTVKKMIVRILPSKLKSMESNIPRFP